MNASICARQLGQWKFGQGFPKDMNLTLEKQGKRNRRENPTDY